jgi:hypothetical protein
LSPDQRKLRECLLHAFAVVAHFDDEQPAGIEMRDCFIDDAPHEIEAVSPTSERQRRLFSIFAG